MKKGIIFILLLMFSVSFAFAVNFTVDLTDDYGDGWNGGLLDVTVAGTLVLDDITLATGSGPETYTFDVNDGDLVELDYVEGGWSYENAYYVYNNIGALVTSSGDGGVTPDAHVEFTAVVPGGTTGGDTCSIAEAIGEVTDYPFDTTLATASGFGTYITSQDLWYVYTAPADGILYVGVCDSGFDTKLALYGECDDTTLIDFNDDSCGLQSELTDVPVVAGEDYFIQVGGYGTSAGAGVLDVAFAAAGDFCEDAIAVGEVVGYPFDTTYATTSGFDTHSFNQDLWFVYTASSDGTIYVDLCDSSFDTKLAIYGECDVATELGYNDDSCGAMSELFDIAVVGGEDYYIQVGGYGSYYGAGFLDIELTSSFVPEPPTNLFVTEEAYATWEAPSGGGGDALYSQLDFVSTEGGITAQDFETAFDAYDAEGADEFVVPAGETWTIDQVVILGTGPSAPIELANIRFYADNAGVPGTMLFEYLDVVSIPGADADLDCTIPATVFTEGTYWLGVQGDIEYGLYGQWFWNRQAAPTIGYEFYWRNPGDGFGYGAIDWTAGSIIWPTNVDMNLSFGLFGTLAEDDKVIVKSYESNTTPFDRIAVKEMDPRILKKGPQLTGPGSATDSRALLGYNTYIDGVFDGFTTELFYQYLGLVDGTTYLAGVTALYDEGESASIDYSFTYVEPVVPEYIEIGDGTTYGTHPSYYADFCNYWENAHTQTLYLASELGEAKTLTELSWEFERIAEPDNWLDNVVISIMTTSDDVLTPGAFYDTSGATVVWGPVSGYIPATEVGWNDPMDITDFAYNGTDNLIVDILWGDNGYYESPYYRHMRTDAGVTRVLLGYADSETPPNYDAATTEFANIRFYYEESGTEAPDVLISEYIEGSSNNKAMEIWNNTGDVINLDDFRIAQSVNGGGWAYWHIFPAGATVADQDVWVILNEDTDVTLFDPANADEILAYPSVVHHNGDDARGLEYTADGGATWTLIDIIGDPDVDPGAGWDVAGVTEATANHTLVRKEEITTGNIDWVASAGTNATDSEWIVYDVDTFDYLGQHPGGGGGPVIVVTPMSINETLDPDDIVVVPVTIENTGTEELTFDITVVETSDVLGGKTFAPVHTNVTPRVMTPDKTLEYSPMETHVTGNLTDEIWDVQGTFRPIDASGVASQAGMEFDGTYFYCPVWNSADICKYDIDGNFVETFQVAGVSGTRDLAYDGEYMYGGSSGSQIYCWDPVTYTLITTINSSEGVYRAIAYDSVNDGFLGNNWDGQIVCTARDGSTIYIIPDTGIASSYGMAYDNASAGGPFLWIFSQAGSGAEIHQIDIASGLPTGVMHDVLIDFPSTGIAGGLWTSSDYLAGTVTIGGLVQGEDAFMYELCPGDEPWITADPLTGTVPAGTSVVVDVTLDATGLVDITKTADIIIGNNAGDDVIVDVTMIVTEGAASPFNPPVNVEVDGETALVSWYPPANNLMFDDFESYTVGDYVALSAPDIWTTWSNNPGSAEDALVSDAYALSGSNSMVVQGSNDMVLIMEDYFSGIYSIELNLLMATGNSGYFNLQKTSTPGEEWAFQILFETDGIATADAGAAAAFTFPFDFDTWINMELVVDLNADWCDIYVDGDMVFGYQWTLGTFGTPGLLQFGGMNLFASGGSPMCYYDDIILNEIVPATDELTDFNIYFEDMVTPVATVSAGVLEYQLDTSVLTIGDSYTAGVSAVYDDPGESEIVEVEFIYDPDFNFLPPSNFAAEVVDYNDVVLTWEQPTGSGGEFLHHTGYDNNGIGTGGVVEFINCGRFDDVELGEFYDASAITEVQIHIHSADFSYVGIVVYEGGSVGDPGTEVYNVDVTADIIPMDWTTHVLSTPIPLVSGNEYWIGYEIHATADHPASVDAGPMVPDKGGMMFYSGAWTTLFALGLDYNWCITGVAAPLDNLAMGKVIGAKKKVQTTMPNFRTTGIFEAEFTRTNAQTPARESRSLSGYKIYRDGTEIVEITGATILTYTDESLDTGTYEYTIEGIYTNPNGVSELVGPVTAEVDLGPPSNVDAQSQPPNVVVTWAAPARGVESYNVYRDGVEIASGLTTTLHIDIAVPTGTYLYSVEALYDGGWTIMSDEVEVDHVGGDDILKPTVTELTGNYPNPFNPTTTISFSLKEAGHVSINIYNMRGQLVKTLVNAELENAYHEIVWNGKDNSGKSISSGVYFYKMKAQTYNSTKKMILMK